MAVDVNKLVDVEQAKLDKFKAFVTQNSRNELYFNPKAMATFDKTVVTPTEAIGYEFLSDTDIAIYFVEPGTDQSVPFKRPANKRTGRCSFSSILYKKPYLKVGAGRVNRFPFRLELPPTGTTPRFIITIQKPKVARTESKGKAAKAKAKKTPATAQAPGLMTDDQSGAI
jgi:hypothetical protein